MTVRYHRLQLTRCSEAKGSKGKTQSERLDNAGDTDKAKYKRQQFESRWT
jgi:hypothetical protein